MLQAAKPMILLCDVDRVAIVKATHQHGQGPLIVRRFSPWKRGAKKFYPALVQEEVERICRHLMSCLME